MVETFPFILRPKDGARAAEEVPRGRLREASSFVAGKSCPLFCFISPPALLSSQKKSKEYRYRIRLCMT